ncbi:ParB/RepB/Spo0J family partition protein [Niveibacterium sp. 24ML]|uniref:ParB/RepB/Spo0J family partition protein n=1 Tax=Niveibacterium sp. 24ML TaxID=2985512 RepID=UPI00227027E6|nr:ParB/RepB/Spo0J family partition protein [Niveibacterium sp. 24ML]MCX9155485.1 ParB/RepB/Spo0J family partition protein [Niveibacterium sp. 24ML]
MGFKETVPEFRMIDVAKLVPDEAHPRRQYDEAGLKRLADSITGVGVIQPVVVQPADAEGKFRLIVGERRLRAAMLAGEAQIPALVRACPPNQTLEVQVFENLGQGVRLPLAPREMAQALKTIARGFESPEAAAEHFGQPATWLEQKTAPANLSPKVEALLESGQITSCTTAVQLDKLAQKNEARLDALVAEVERGEKLPKKAVEAALVAEGVKRAKKPAEPDAIAEVPVPRSAEPIAAPASARRVNPGKVRMVAQILGLDAGDEEAVLDRLIDEFLALKGEGNPPF